MQVLSAIGDSLRMAFFMFWDTLWPLIFGFGLSGAVQAFVSRSEMQRVMGDHRPKTLGMASIFGAASSSCSYAASAMAKSLFQKGADFTTAMVFMLASTNLVIELGLVLWILIGWQFALSEYVGGIIMIGLLALVARFFFRPALVERARQHLAGRSSLSNQDEHVGEPGGEEVAPLARRLRSPAGWADAATYTMADLVMLRKEMIVGYLVAGFLAVMVPKSLWNTIFFRGHGFATSIENVIVGPLIAILSFVCSIGNVPLAAALWKGGISFGGVVSFIFADLITFPLLLIYRRFYGWALTLRILAAFWLVMAAAGLATEYLFAGAGLVPVGRPAHSLAAIRVQMAGIAVLAGAVALADPHVVGLVLTAFRVFVPGIVPQAVLALLGRRTRSRAVAVSMVAGPPVWLAVAWALPGLQETPADPVLWGAIVAVAILVLGRVPTAPARLHEH